MNGRMDMEFYRDADGSPRVRAGRLCETLGRFLEEDLQESADFCRAVLGAIDDVSAGRILSWEETGNAHTLALSPDRAVIESNFDPGAKPCLLELACIKDVVNAWLEFVQEPA